MRFSWLAWLVTTISLTVIKGDAAQDKKIRKVSDKNARNELLSADEGDDLVYSDELEVGGSALRLDLQRFGLPTFEIFGRNRYILHK